jgi:hypothetical protein
MSLVDEVRCITFAKCDSILEISKKKGGETNEANLKEVNPS